MRQTGIDVLGDAPWGTHFCQFYETSRDLIEILVPYFKAGLENNEFCMWITSEPLSAGQARAALASEVPDLNDRIRRGQIEFLDYSQWYTPGGKFDSERVLQAWVERVETAQHRGFDGLRLTGNTFWLEKADWAGFTQYEAAVDRVIGGYPMLAICTYSLAKCGAAEIMDVVSNHAFALMKRAGRWQIIESANRKRVEASLNRTLRAHTRSNQALLHAIDEAGYLQEVCRIIVEDCGHAMVWVGYREDDAAKTVRPVAHSGFDEGYLETLNITWDETERGQGPTGTAIRTGRVCTCRNMLVDPLFLPWREQAVKRGYASSIVLPLLAGDNAFGALNIYARDPDPFSEDEVKLLTGLAADFAFGINVLRLRAAHALAEQTLQESEERYRSLVEMSPDAVFVNLNGRIIQVNGAALRLLGARSPEQVIGKPAFEIFHPDYHEVVRERILKVMAGETVPLIEERIIRLDGSLCDVEVAASRCREKQEFAVQVILRDITERKAAEQALRQYQEWLRVTLASIGDAVLATDTSGAVTFLNPVAEALTGWTQAQSLGRPAQEVLRIVNERTGADAEDIVRCALRERRVLSLANHSSLVARDGRRIPVEDSAAPILGVGGDVLGAVVVFHDVTGQRRAQEALRESEERYRSLFRNMAEGFALYEILGDAGGAPREYRFVDVNPGFERMTGLNASGVLGKTLRETLPGIEPRVIETYDKVALTGEPATFETYSRELGRWYDIVAYRPSPGRLAVILMDVTGRKAAEDRLREAQKLESIGVLAGGIAHDFNNLLVGVIGNANLAQDITGGGGPVADLLDKVVNAGEKLAGLTAQMLAYSGKGRLFPEPLNLSDLIPEMCLLVQSSLPNRTELLLDLGSGVPPIEADRGQMQQVFTNLVLNAAEAIGETSPGTIGVRTGVRRIDGGSATELPPGQYAFLEVRDTGCGMDRQTQARIFDPFFSTKFLGRGLGLAAVSGIVRGHHGAITVESAVGKGSCFTVLFPAVRDASARPPARPENVDLAGRETILVVDDDAGVREIAQRALERRGYRVLLAESGPAALDIAGNPGEIGLVILDLSMPGMSGEEVLRELRKIRPCAKVTVASGYSEAQTMRMFAGQRVSGFLQKPFTAARLAETVRGALAEA